MKTTPTVSNEKEFATTNHVKNIKRNHAKTNQLFSTVIYPHKTDELKNRSSPEGSIKMMKRSVADFNTDKSINNSKISDRAPKVKASLSINTSLDIGTVFMRLNL